MKYCDIIGGPLNVECYIILFLDKAILDYLPKFGLDYSWTAGLDYRWQGELDFNLTEEGPAMI